MRCCEIWDFCYSDVNYFIDRVIDCYIIIIKCYVKFIFWYSNKCFFFNIFFGWFDIVYIYFISEIDWIIWGIGKFFIFYFYDNVMWFVNWLISGIFNNSFIGICYVIDGFINGDIYFLYIGGKVIFGECNFCFGSFY